MIPEHDGSVDWTPVAVSHARMVARLRERGHSLDELRAGRRGGPARDRVRRGPACPTSSGEIPFDEAADEIGLEPALVERIWTRSASAPRRPETLTEEDVQALRYVASVLEAGFPLVAFLQLLRVYGQALAQIADAETRLFHIYVHEPLMREGVPGLEMAEEMEDLARDLLPLASPIMDYLHQRFLQHFVEQDVVGHMEVELDESIDLGRVRVDGRLRGPGRATRASPRRRARRRRSRPSSASSTR